MIEYSIDDGQILFKVQVVPRASRTEIIGEHNGALKIRLAAPPVEGVANEELVRLLAKTFGVSRSAVTITSGRNSRIKKLRVTGARANFLERFASK